MKVMETIREWMGRGERGPEEAGDYAQLLTPGRWRLLGATSREEQAWCEWAGAERFRGEGCIVEFGPWLGSLTMPLMVGLLRNPRAGSRTIHTYDLFRWEPGSNGWAKGTPFDRLYQPGDSFLPLYEQLVAPFRGAVDLHIHEGDLSRADWTGAPIELLINDAWKTMPLMSGTVQRFFPSLREGATVFHQDYLWCTESWIHVGMYRLRNWFAFERRLPNSSTVIFRMTKRVPPEVLAGFAGLADMEGLREDEVDAAFDWSLSFLEDPEARLVAKAGKGWLLHRMGLEEKARRVFAEIWASPDYAHPFYQNQERTLRDWGFGKLM